jgi:hypothetical protein
MEWLEEASGVYHYNFRTTQKSAQPKPSQICSEGLKGGFFTFAPQAPRGRN